MLASSVGGPGFNTGNIREILALSQELRLENNNIMDNIWYRNPSKSEVIGRYGGGGKK